MSPELNYWPLIGVAVVIGGFALRRNPVLVVVAAGLASGLAAGVSLPDLLALLGKTFVENRVLLLFLLTLPAIGVLEHHGLRERAKRDGAQPVMPCRKVNQAAQGRISSPIRAFRRHRAIRPRQATTAHNGPTAFPGSPRSRRNSLPWTLPACRTGPPDSTPAEHRR